VSTDNKRVKNVQNRCFKDYNNQAYQSKTLLRKKVETIQKMDSIVNWGNLLEGLNLFCCSSIYSLRIIYHQFIS
jgi:hypothetical protein